MIISIASGKGGTGKTTVAVNMALALGRRAMYLDCDVEEPNGHLFLHPVIDAARPVSTFVPEVNQELCNGCRKCAEICRFRAITVIRNTVLTFPELCHSCEGCMVVCPEKAITAGQRVLGELEEGHCGEITFRQGRLRVGEAMAPPLIRAVRANLTNANGRTIIVDAPPGTSCPAIAATRHSDFVLMVTEPTPFGLHDLKLAVEAMTFIGLPCGLVINRADMGDDAVRQYAREKNIPVLMEIPFDRKIAEAYSRGIPIIEILPAWKEKFCQLHARIGEAAGKREVCQ